MADGLLIDENELDALGLDELEDESGSGGDNLLDDFTEEQIQEIKDKDESDLTDDEKAVLEAAKNKDESLSDDNGNDENEINLEDYTDEQLNEIRNKSEDELDDKEKAIQAYLKENDDSQEPESGIQQFVQAAGVKEFASKQYEDNEEGLKTFASDYKEHIKNSAVEETFNQYPEMVDFWKHLKSGRSSDTFLIDYQKPEFESFDISKEEGQEEMLRYDYKLKGLAKDEIDFMVDKIKNEGKLEERSKSIHSDLKAQVEREKQEYKEEEEKLLKAQRERDEKQQQEVSKIIKSRKLRGMNLSEQEAKDFENYLYNVVELENGNKILQSTADYNKLSTSDKLFIKMIQKKLANGEEIKGIESSKIRNTNFKIIAKKNDKRNKGGDKNNNKGGNNKNTEYSLKDVLGITKVTR